MERHFRCTACGKCCLGWLPLTLDDAWRHAERFPLAFLWRAVPAKAKAFALAEQIGATVRIPRQGRIAVVIMPIAYLPPDCPCPELAPDGRCAIHDSKPQRCRTMPFFPYLEEKDQADLLTPRATWLCDTSESAPIVYRDRQIIDRADFDRERQSLLEQAPLIRTYVDYAMKYMPWVLDRLGPMSLKPDATLITSLSSFLTAHRQLDVQAIAQRQLAVLGRFAAQAQGHKSWEDYHQQYTAWSKEMDYLAQYADNA